MKYKAIGIRPVFAILIASLIVLIVGFAVPSSAQAAEVSVQTAQLLPPGSNSCGTLQVSGFTPYIYDGSLHAFEFTVADSSYVAVAGAAGSTDIPFNQMTRRIDAAGNLRVHADMTTTRIGQGITVLVTMLSANQGAQTVCISIISAGITSEGVGPVLPPAPAPAPSPTPTVKPTPAPTPKPTPPAPAPTPTPFTKATGTATSAPVMAQNILKDMCAAGGATRLWFILLAIYAIVVAAAVFGQPQLPPALRSQEWVAAAIVLPFLLLFGLWYFVESCRISAWVPAIATLIALAGLAAAFWDRSNPPTTRVINLPSSKS